MYDVGKNKPLLYLEINGYNFIALFSSFHVETSGTLSLEYVDFLDGVH